MKRTEILAEAARLTAGDRNETYGDPTKNMRAFSLLLEAFLRARGFVEHDRHLTAEDAAIVMALAKLARLWSDNLPYHPDNYIDAAAYIAMAGECAE